MFISLIFVVHRRFVLILAIKLYFLWEHIIHNHPNQLELIVILVWLYLGISQKHHDKSLLQLMN